MSKVEGIKVSRGDLLLSQAAIGNLGSNHTIVGEKSYWLAKTLRQLGTALKREQRAAQTESNRLIEELGTEILNEKNEPTGKRGIVQTDVKAMEQYADAMESFNAGTIELENVRAVKLQELSEIGISLQLNDQAALHWLIQE